jgi:hypothetical protein
MQVCFLDTKGAFLKTPLYLAGVFLGTTSKFFLAPQVHFENTPISCRCVS